MVAYAQQVVDVMNTWSVLLHFSEVDAELIETLFIEGGDSIDRTAFARLITFQTLQEATRGLAEALRNSALGAAIGERAQDMAALEAAVLRVQIQEQRRAARVRSDGAAPLILFALAMRAEVLNLRRLIWGIALETPGALVKTNLIVP